MKHIKAAWIEQVLEFDELNISQSDKENRIESFNAASKNLMDLFEEYKAKAIDDKQLLSKVRDILITIGISAGLYFLDIGKDRKSTRLNSSH